jgi:phosphocarrier protein
LSDAASQAAREVEIRNREGLHARPVMRFVDLASQYGSTIRVVNVTRNDEQVDGKSAMQMMLLEATQGSVLRIEAWGEDAHEAVDALAALVGGSFGMDPPSDSQSQVCG